MWYTFHWICLQRCVYHIINGNHLLLKMWLGSFSTLDCLLARYGWTEQLFGSVWLFSSSILVMHYVMTCGSTVKASSPSLFFRSLSWCGQWQWWRWSSRLQRVFLQWWNERQWTHDDGWAPPATKNLAHQVTPSHSHHKGTQLLCLLALLATQCHFCNTFEGCI